MDTITANALSFTIWNHRLLTLMLESNLVVSSVHQTAKYVTFDLWISRSILGDISRNMLLYQIQPSLGTSSPHLFHTGGIDAADMKNNPLHY